MATSTQASQLRLSQRLTDSGWVSPEVLLEANSTVTPGTWINVSTGFTLIGSGLQITGSVAQSNVVFVRTAGVPGAGNIYRMSYPNGEDSVLTPQRAGSLSIATKSGSDRVWAFYDLVVTPDGYFQVPDASLIAWPAPVVGDVLQFTGTWFTEEQS